MKGFLVNKTDGNRVFPNKTDDIQTGTVLYRNFDFEFEKQLTNSKITRKIGVTFTIKDSELAACDEDNNKVSLRIPDGEPAQNPKKAEQTFKKQLEKTGESDFYTLETRILTEKLPFLPVSKINELRREILSLLSKERLSKYNRLVQKPIGYGIFPTAKSDYHANVLNNEAKNFYKNCKCEIIQDALESHKDIPSGIELMRCKHCLKFAAGLCRKPTAPLFLVDSSGKKYPLKFDCKNCEMVVLAP